MVKVSLGVISAGHKAAATENALVGIMKEFKLTAWPELPAPYQRIAYRRMLSDMSHRFVTAQQLCDSSGATKLEVRVFLQMLSERGLLRERDHDEPNGLLGPLGGWLRRTINGEGATH
jgi:hypothetical protein